MPGQAYSAPALSGRVHQDSRRPRPGVAGPLRLAALCLAALVLTWLVAEHVPAVRLRDAIALHDLTLLNRPFVETVGEALLQLLSPLSFVVLGAAIVFAALARERPRVAAAVALVLVLAPLSADRLKPLLAHPHVRVGAVHIGPSSWPSGHATAALALVLCAVLAAPARARPAVAAIGALFAAAVGLALLILAWHMPSDVLGGYLVATLWMALAVAALRFAERRWPTRPRASS
jgi:membrane-associated phospholipid phosphatase